jgi:hypothetical protein
MPRGHRWMYYATGLPGWMRFGFSPGWVGRSPTGLGPCATYFMTGEWPTPQAQAYWQAMQSGQATYPAFTPFWGGTPGQTAPASELDLLRNQAELLGSQLDQIRGRIAELEKAAE